MRYIDAERLEECMRIVQRANKDSVEFNKQYRATDVFFNIWDIINEQPTADVVEVVRGEWIKITDVDIRLTGRQIKEVHYKCSVCGGESYFDTNYCPHCGARMDGVE